MKAMYAAFLAAAVIAVIGDFGLGGLGFSSGERSAGAAVRLSDSAE